MLGFGEEILTVDDEEILSSSSGYKLVPWLSWDEWNSVRESLFSSSTDKVASALKRVSTWRSRGSLPVIIDVTAAIIEIQQKDPYYREKEDQPTDVLESEQMLAMLHCMAILRLVNCVVEKTRKKTEISITEAAKTIGIPRKLIDVRHEGSHRDLPSLQVLRDCSDKALDWLKSYYWEPQKDQIPSQRDEIAVKRSKIESKLHELASYLKLKQSSQLDTSLVRGKPKRIKYCEMMCGRNKFLPITAGKLHSSKYGGSKTKITKCLKGIVRLYSSYSSEMVSMLLESLLNILGSSILEFQNNSHAIQNIYKSLDGWKPVIARLSNKEPELLLTLLKAVLGMIENIEAENNETGIENLTSPEDRKGANQMERLSYLCYWLVGLLKGLNPICSTESVAEVKLASGKYISKDILVELMRKCLLVSGTGNKLLMDSALDLAQLLGNTSLTQKLSKLSSISLSHLDVHEENSSLSRSKNIHEDSIRQAAKKLELVKQHRMKSKAVKTTDGDVGIMNSRWVVSKSWKPCPIGMLPSDLGPSGRVPVLECNNDNKQNSLELSERKETSEQNRCCIGKREASCDIEPLDNSNVKKMKVTVEESESDNEDRSLSEDDAKGCLMIGGVWKKVGEEELQTIMSGVRIPV